MNNQGTDQAAKQATESELLAIVQALAQELHPHRQALNSVQLDNDLDHDLGLDSLGRAELLLRISRAFSVQLPESLLGDANTPRDLLAAVEHAGPRRSGLSTAYTLEGRNLPGIDAPVSAVTLIEVLEFHVQEHGERPHLSIRHGDGQDSSMSYRELHHAALEVAYGLLDQGLTAGDRVAIMLPTEENFFTAYMGVLYAGGVPVPVYPPFRRSQVEDHLRRQAGILNNAEAAYLIAADELRGIGSILFGLVDTLKSIETVSSLANHGVLEMPCKADEQTVALIQYTSGSTGDPKGVVLTHANLLANIRAMCEALQASSTDVFVSWLPLYHDMGLIGAWLGSLYQGVHVIFMRPLAFLADPISWLRTLSDYKGTLSAAPNFAFELCCKSIRDEDLHDLDLRSLRCLLNGAEPVSARTIERFSDRFSACGFRPEMMWPVYGLAENSVGLAFPPHAREPVIDRVQRTALTRDSLAVTTDAQDTTALTFVACGQPIPRHQVRIVDHADRELPERAEGRLQFKGPSATSGYFRNAEKTRTLFSGEWLESGDRAYVANGDIFITGRVKDMIIKAGRNIYPHEIEELVGELDGVRKGCVAAFASTEADAGTERLVLAVETRLDDPGDRQRLQERITSMCSRSLNMAPDVIALLPPRTIPKTSSGKIRRTATREMYEAGFGNIDSRRVWVQVLRLAGAGLCSRARRLNRQVGELAFAAYWWTLLVLIAIPAWLLVVTLPRQRWRFRVVRMAAMAFLDLTGARPRVSHHSALPEGETVIIANHSSYLDSLVLIAILPGTPIFVAKEELAREWVAGPFLKRLGTRFVRRSSAEGGIEDTKLQNEAIRAGKSLVYFPEGTLTRMPGLLAFRLGAFLVAAENAATVVPIVLRGTRSILRADQWFPRRGTIEVDIGEPLYSDGDDFRAAVRLRDHARAVVLEHCGEPDLARERVQLPPDRTD